MRYLITGVTGQDGWYLAETLVEESDDVYGMVRGQRIPDLPGGVRMVRGDLTDPTSLLDALDEADPDIVFNLAGVTAPALGFDQPVHTGDVTGLGFVRLMEAIGTNNVRVIQAGSLATHGPYGAAKSYTAAMAADYRSRGRDVSVAVMAGHHSPRRGTEFFARMVSRAAHRHSLDPTTPKLELGWLGREADWGWSPNFCDGLLAVAAEDPGEYILATDDPHTSEEWVAACYAAAELDWRDHVTVTGRRQASEVDAITGRPDPRLAWDPKVDFRGLARWMVENE